MLDVSFLSEIDLFRHLPDSCLRAIEKASNVLNCGFAKGRCRWQHPQDSFRAHAQIVVKNLETTHLRREASRKISNAM